jgi:hypothetical protein
VYSLNLEVVRRYTYENTENMFNCIEKKNSENTENDIITHFDSPIFLNISFQSLYNNYGHKNVSHYLMEMKTVGDSLTSRNHFITSYSSLKSLSIP